MFITAMLSKNMNILQCKIIIWAADSVRRLYQIQHKKSQTPSPNCISYYLVEIMKSESEWPRASQSGGMQWRICVDIRVLFDFYPAGVRLSGHKPSDDHELIIPRGKHGVVLRKLRNESLNSCGVLGGDSVRFLLNIIFFQMVSIVSYQ